MQSDNQTGQPRTTISLDQWNHFQRLSEEHHHRQQAEIERLRGKLASVEVEARRYAEFYPQSSDGRNTFTLLADRIAEIANG